MRRFINADKYVKANDDLLGFNMYTYCGNNAVNMEDYDGENAKSLLYTWFTAGGSAALIEPTFIGETILVVGGIVIGGIIIINCTIEIVGNIVETFESTTTSQPITYSKSKDDADPYAGPGQKSKDANEKIKRVKRIIGNQDLIPNHQKTHTRKRSQEV